MIGRLSDCFLLSYRTPAASVGALVPRPLELVTHGGYAFWNIVACRVEAMRPRWTPRWLGVTYRHIGYRLHVRCRIEGQPSIEGLYFVRSDADRSMIACGGNWMTDFRFHEAEIALRTAEGAWGLTVHSHDGEGDASVLAKPTAAARLADGSPFSSSAEAAEALKYQPFALAPTVDGRAIKLAEVFRDESAWHESPIDVVAARWAFFDALGQQDARLELATRVRPIDYRWRLGRRLPAAATPRSPC